MTTSQTSSGSGEITATGIAIVEEAAWSGEEEAEKERRHPRLSLFRTRSSR